MNLQFYPNVPVSSNNPSADQPDMTTNNQSINAWVGIDHIGFNANQGGWHTVIHQKPFDTWVPTDAMPSAPPLTSPNSGMFYAMSYKDPTTGTTDIQPFAQSGNGGVYILGANNKTYTNGWFWSGGILIQFGYQPFSGIPGSISAQKGTLTYSTASGDNNFAFPKNILHVEATLAYSSADNTAGIPATLGTISINSQNINATQFQWVFQTNSAGNYSGFYWTAIGY